MQARSDDLSSADPYRILGVSRNASWSEIRRAYKEVCLKFHPDKVDFRHRAAATHKFKLVNDAYQTLSNNATRSAIDAQLDQHTNNPAYSFSSMTSDTPSPSPSPFENEDYRRQFAANFERKMRSEGQTPLEGEELFSALFGQARQNFRFDGEQRKADSQNIRLPLSLEQLHNGCIIRRPLQRTVRDRVNGGLQHKTVIMRIDIDKGYRPGDRIRFRGAGSETESFSAADVVFVLEQKEHARFIRNSDDLHLQLPITLSEALLGIDTFVVGIDGEKLAICSDTITKPGETLTIPNKGMVRRGKGKTGERGDLIIQFRVQFPDRLNSVEKRVVKEVLGRIENRALRQQTNDATDSTSTPNMTLRRSASLFLRSREFSDADKSSTTLPNLKRTPTSERRNAAGSERVSEGHAPRLGKRWSRGWRRPFGQAS